MTHDPGEGVFQRSIVVRYFLCSRMRDREGNPGRYSGEPRRNPDSGPPAGIARAPVRCVVINEPLRTGRGSAPVP